MHDGDGRTSGSFALKRLVDTSVKAGLFLAVLAEMALGISALVGGAEGLIIATIAGPLLAIAIVNFIFEPFGRNAMAEDIREMLGCERRVIEAGLRDVLDGRAANPPLSSAHRPAYRCCPGTRHNGPNGTFVCFASWHVRVG
jgi:hypothetical protein